MSSRDRKRAARRKRKDRSTGEGPYSPAAAEAEAEALAEAHPEAAHETPSTNGRPEETIEDVAAEADRRGITRSEVRNERVRAELEPLEEEGRAPDRGHDRGADLARDRPQHPHRLCRRREGRRRAQQRRRASQRLSGIPPAILFLVMAWGMWGARYWAVLGFRAIMAIIMIGAFLTLIAATTVFKALSAAAILIGTGALWFTVKALARIQMPTPRDPDNP